MIEIIADEKCDKTYIDKEFLKAIREFVEVCAGDEFLLRLLQAVTRQLHHLM